MPSTIIKRVGPGLDYETMSAAIAWGLSTDPVADDTNYVIRTNIDWDATGGLGLSFASGKTDDTRRLIIEPDTGKGFADISGSRTPFAYPPAGVKIATRGGSRLVVGRGVVVQGFRHNGDVGSGNQVLVTDGGLWRRNRSRFTVGGVSLMQVQTGGVISDSLVVLNGITAQAAIFGFYNTGGSVLRCTMLTQNCTNVTDFYTINTYGLHTIKGNVGIGHTSGIYLDSQSGSSNGGSIEKNFTTAAPQNYTGTGFTTVADASTLVDNVASDARPKAGGPLIAASYSDAQGTLDNNGSGRGTVPDVGAFQRVAQTATSYKVDGPVYGVVNAAPVPGRVVTNNPVAADTIFTLTAPAGVTLNPTSLTILAGQSEASFTMASNSIGVKTIQATNNQGLPTASFDWTVRIPKPSGTFTSQTLDGQRLTVKVAYGDAPASGSVSIPPAASSPNGAVAQGPFPMTLSGGVGTAVCDITAPGNYGKSVTTLVNDGGSFEILSADPVPSMQSVSGSGEGTGGTEQPVGEAPTVTIANASAGVGVINANGYASFKGDATGALTASYVPRNGTATIGPDPVTVNSGNWTLSKTGLDPKAYDLVMSITGNGQFGSATAGPLTVTSSTPDPDPELQAPTVSVVAAAVNGLSIAGAVRYDLMGDSSGSVALYLMPEGGGSPVGPLTASLSSGVGAVAAAAPAGGGYRLQARASANGKTATANSQVLTAVAPPTGGGDGVRVYGDGFNSWKIIGEDGRPYWLMSELS